MNIFKPTASLLAKIGSIIVHVEEGRSDQGHTFDWQAVDSLLCDAEVSEWLNAMCKSALVPVKRK